MDATTFAHNLVEKIALLQPKGYGAQWTSGMYPVLYEIGIENNFFVQCKPFDYRGARVGDKELLTIDFMYLPNTFDPDGYIHYPPVVVIEHENNWDYWSKREDFWKMCLITSQLRVFMGYCANEATAREQGRQLAKLYSDHDMKQIVGGETLILISADRSAGTSWLSWLLKDGRHDWQESRVEPTAPADPSRDEKRCPELFPSKKVS